MKLSTRSRVVKNNVVEVRFPRLVESQMEDFQFLGKHISVVRDMTEDEASIERKDPGGINPEEQMRAEVSTLLNRAKEQAEEIIAKAQEEAQQIYEQARIDTEALKAQVRVEVSRQAYQEGFAEGKAQGYTAGKEQAHKLLELAKRAVLDEYSRVDTSLVHLAIKISERIIHSSLDRHPELILRRIRALTLLPEERKGWRLRVSPVDAEWLQELSPQEQLDIPLFSDESLNPGDCALECKEGIFDARLKEQLDRFEKLLGEELKHDRLEQAGR